MAKHINMVDRAFWWGPCSGDSRIKKVGGHCGVKENVGEPT